MVDVRVTYQSGNKRIVVHNDDSEDGPTVYTPEEAEQLKEQLEEYV